MSQANRFPTTPALLSGDACPCSQRPGAHAVPALLPSDGGQPIRVPRPKPAIAAPAASEEEWLPPLPCDIGEGPSDIMVGEAGAHLVQSRLMRWGLSTHGAGPGTPYDVLTEAGPAVGLIRLQVKTTAQPPRGRCYRFRLARGFHRSPRGVFAYRAGDFDIAAFVVLGLDRVLFRIFGRPSFSATPAEFLAADAERRSLRAALAGLMVRRGVIPPAGL